jgi:hypothetical protein
MVCATGYLFKLLALGALCRQGPQAISCKLERLVTVVVRDDDNLFQITERRLKEGVTEGLRSSYLTALSIIQGVAFGTLIFNGAEAAAAIQDDPKVSVFFLISISFGNIILVWFEYSWLIRFRSRHPMFIGAVIPFLVGAAEVAPTFFFDNPLGWAIATVAFLAVSIVAYWIPFKYIGPQPSRI